MKQWFRSLNLLIKIAPVADINEPCTSEADGGPTSTATGTALEQLAHALYTNQTSIDPSEVAVKVLLVPRSGYLCRNDILKLRMHHCACVESVFQFSPPDGYFHSITDQDESSLLALFSSAPGAFLASRSSATYAEALDLIEEELTVRFAFDWVLSAKPSIRRLALIGGRPQFDMQRWSFGHQGTFEAASALGISVIVVDRPGHWLQAEEYSYLRDEFISVDVTEDAGLPSRIAGVLNGQNVHGIVTLSDEFVIATAKAAEILGLPTEPVQSILNSHHKHETRKILGGNMQTLRLDNAEELQSPSVIEAISKMGYPLIVKPCRGGASRGVKKADDYSSLCQAVQSLEETGFAKYGILLEPYVDGPEVDANFVLWEREILFFELGDDFPCEADAPDATMADNFAETMNLLPSRLNTKEMELIKTSLHRSLLKLGFRSGVYHVEARIRNSSMCYKTTDGILDLMDVATAPEGETDVFLIEVNARPPGLQSVWATAYTYGVDYVALQLLRALEDGERLKILSTPFACQAQYCCAIVSIPVHREKIVVPVDFCERVINRLPEIASHVSRAECLASGKTVSPIGGTGFIGYFLIYSKTSRRRVLEMGGRIREVSKIILDGF